MGRGTIARLCFPLIQEHVRVVVCDAELRSVVMDGVETIDNAKRNEPIILSAIERRNIDAIVSVQHIWVLSQEVLDAVNQKAYNLHNAKLPEYGGYNTITHAILNGETEYWTTIHVMGKDVDVGDILYERAITIDETDTAWSLYMKSVPVAVDNFKEFSEILVSGRTLVGRPITGDVHFYKRIDADILRMGADFKNDSRAHRAFSITQEEE